MRVEYYIPSYKRPQKSITQKNYTFAKVVVSEDDADAYKKNGNDIIVVPNSAQGNVCRIRNYILNNVQNADCCIFMDDDCSGIFIWQKQKKIKLSHTDLQEFCEINTILCIDWGYKLWGLNCVTDKGAYREHTPYSTTSYIGSPFHAHIKNCNILYDENLPLKEDYDITLQHLHKYGGCMRVNYACYDVKQAEQIGGCAQYRNAKKETEQFMLLQKKWGSTIIREDKSSKRSLDFNPILKSPIKGV